MVTAEQAAFIELIDWIKWTKTVWNILNVSSNKIIVGFTEYNWTLNTNKMMLIRYITQIGFLMLKEILINKPNGS
jgi:hypothetical protein